MHATSVMPRLVRARGGPHCQAPNGTDVCVGLVGGLVVGETGGELADFEAGAVAESRGCPPDRLGLADECEPVGVGSPGWPPVCRWRLPGRPGVGTPMLVTGPIVGLVSPFLVSVAV